jgi:hypothetical protein
MICEKANQGVLPANSLVDATTHGGEPGVSEAGVDGLHGRAKIN